MDGWRDLDLKVWSVGFPVEEFNRFVIEVLRRLPAEDVHFSPFITGVEHGRSATDRQAPQERRRTTLEVEEKSATPSFRIAFAAASRPTRATFSEITVLGASQAALKAAPLIGRRALFRRL